MGKSVIGNVSSASVNQHACSKTVALGRPTAHQNGACGWVESGSRIRPFPSWIAALETCKSKSSDLVYTYSIPRLGGTWRLVLDCR